jgi:hypothetical protein
MHSSATNLCYLQLFFYSKSSEEHTQLLDEMQFQMIARHLKFDAQFEHRKLFDENVILVHN